MSLTMKMFMGIWLKDPGDLTFCHGCMCIPGLHIILKIVFHVNIGCPLFWSKKPLCQLCHQSTRNLICLSVASVLCFTRAILEWVLWRVQVLCYSSSGYPHTKGEWYKEVWSSLSVAPCQSSSRIQLKDKPWPCVEWEIQEGPVSLSSI